MLHIYPQICLMDKELDITITDLLPGQHITVSCKVIEKNYPYVSHAHYVASLDGNINLKHYASFGGSYLGISQMGIFWSMTPMESEKTARRYGPTNVTRPAEYHLQVFNEHLSRNEINKCSNENVLIEGKVLRYCCAPTVNRTVVKHGRVRGTIFKPSGSGPFKGVVDMYGGAGGIIESRAALLASNGFVAFALPYLAYDDLPQKTIELEYFLEALSYFQSLVYVLPGISLVGLCFGGDIVLHLTTLFQSISSVVSISSKHYFTLGVLDKNKFFPPLEDIPLNSSRADFLQTDEHSALKMDVAVYNEPQCEKVTHKIEKSNGTQFLFIVGEDDKMVNSKASYRILYDRMKRHGKEKQMRVLSFPGAGHFIDPPYIPQSLYGVFLPSHKLVGASGGRVVENAAACMQSWRDMLNFLKENTGILKYKLLLFSF